MKTAVCLSGIPKYIKIGINSINTFIPDADIFAHCWDTSDFDITENCFIGAKNSYKYISGIEELQPIDLKIEKAITKDPEFHIFKNKHEELFQKKYQNPDGPEQNWNWWGISYLSQFYSARESDRLRREHQKKNRMTYDCVIKLRYDSMILKLQDLRTLDQNQLYSASGGEDITECYITGDHKATIISELYSYIDDIITTVESPSAHLILNDYIRRKNFTVIKSASDIRISTFYKHKLTI